MLLAMGVLPACSAYAHRGIRRCPCDPTRRQLRPQRLAAGDQGLPSVHGPVLIAAAARRNVDDYRPSKPTHHLSCPFDLVVGEPDFQPPIVVDDVQHAADDLGRVHLGHTLQEQVM
jgi:hypothetical protein